MNIYCILETTNSIKEDKQSNKDEKYVIRNSINICVIRSWYAFHLSFSFIVLYVDQCKRTGCCTIDCCWLVQGAPFTVNSEPVTCQGISFGPFLFLTLSLSMLILLSHWTSSFQSQSILAEKLVKSLMLKSK
jgi:hypothetical protein